MSELNKKRKVAFYTLGCKLNFAETSTIAREFTQRGFQRVDSSEIADVYIINTCTVTHVADKKSRYIIKKIVRQAPGAFVAVVGCYSQLNANEVAKIPGVDLVLGNDEKFRIFEYIDNLGKTKEVRITNNDMGHEDNFHISYSIDDRTRSFLKVQDGCDYFCTYCTVPFARGRSRNVSIREAVEVANWIASEGVREIVLTGINIGDFGKSTGESFIDLLRQLEKSTDIERYRISSIEPNLLSNEIIELVGCSKKIMPHFHLPLQSGCNKILARMQRKYNADLFVERITIIHQNVADACIGVDLIVGFPGEDDVDFNQTYYLIRDIDISYLHVFTYSERELARAKQFPDKVDYRVKERRNEILKDLSDKKLFAFYQKNLGKNYNVLFEKSEHKGMMEGFTENYIRAESKFQPELIGKVRSARLKEISTTGNVLITF